MKIDFKQDFTAVQRLLNMRANAAYQKVDKQPSITAQPIDFKAQLAPDSMKSGVALSPPPALKPPTISATPLASLSSSSADESVKSVTVLSVERVNLETSHVAPLASSATLDPAVRAALKSPKQNIVAIAPEISDDAFLSQLITSAGIDSGVDPALGIAVASAESSLNARAVSSDGHASKGLFQLLDRTGVELHQAAGGEADGYDPFEPTLNAKLGMRYLRRLHDHFSSPTEIAGIGTSVAAANSASLEKLAVAAFNAGEGRVTSAQTRAAKRGFDASQYEQIAQFLPDSTRSYVAKVVALKGALESSTQTALRAEDDFT